MPVVVAGTCILICCVGFASLAATVVGFALHDMLLATARVRRRPVRDPWTRMLDDSLRANPDLPRLSDAVEELRWHYGQLYRQRCVLLAALATHQRMPGQNTQGGYLERELADQEQELEGIRVRVRELHALVVVRRTRGRRGGMPITDGVVGRLQAEIEVERFRQLPLRSPPELSTTNPTGEFALL